MNAINIEDVKEELKLPDKIRIFDTTLRDGTGSRHRFNS